MEKAFTIGRTTSYDKYLAEDNPQKLGLRAPCKEFPEGYEGGWIWRSLEEAQSFLRGPDFKIYTQWNPLEFSVYELLIESWATSASLRPSSEDGVHRLLFDARILGKVT